MLGKLPFTAGGFADDFEYSGHPLCDPPSGGVDRVVGRNLSLSFFFFFFPPFFYLFIYLYRVSPRWGEALGRNKMSFFQEKIFLTKKNIFRPGANALDTGLPAGSGVLASQGDQPKKGGIFFFFSMILICVVCSINADATLRYAPLRTLSGQKNFSTSAKMSRQTVKTAALTRILHIISRSPPLRNKKKYVRSVACRRFLV